MINIKREEKERCKSDTFFLRSVLETELESVRDDLEVTMPLDTIHRLQGRTQALRDIIKLLH